MQSLRLKICCISSVAEADDAIEAGADAIGLVSAMPSGPGVIDEALIAEKYVGIRPAPGYPACPEHTEKVTLFDLMDVTKRTGIELTESMAMWPGAAVSGWYFSHPQSQYFVVGRLAQDQVADYAKRKGWTLQEAERWLAPNLGYNPED